MLYRKAFQVFSEHPLTRLLLALMIQLRPIFQTDIRQGMECVVSKVLRKRYYQAWLQLSGVAVQNMLVFHESPVCHFYQVVYLGTNMARSTLFSL